ncbi:hypothetical protein BH11PSE10_BH11PSE10_03600 [soil metagenome]
MLRQLDQELLSCAPGDRVDRWRLTDSLHLSHSSLILRAVDSVDGRQAVLKFLRPGVPSMQQLGQFRHEFEVAQRFEHPHILRPLSLSSHAGRPYLVLPDVNAVSLADLLRQGALPSASVVELALALVEALAVVHQAGVVHRDICPGNVLLPRDEQDQLRPTAALLADFGIAAEIASERPLFVHADALEGALATMAPEQTGRMSRDVDYRADFYSLGATLFQALTGEPLFQVDDAAQAVHAHLALPPPLATARRAGVFAPLAAIVNHCLQKTPEARYQSHRTLLQDLRLCRDALAGGRGLPADFQPGQGDHLGRFQLSGQLYGRAAPMQQLAEAFEAAATGPCGLVAIAGFSGIGKTALVTAAQRSLLAQRGNFAAAKFNQFGQPVPYGALLASLAQRATQVLALEPRRRRFWQQRLAEQLGVNAAVVSDAIPEFRSLLPDAPALVALGPLESENRFLRSLSLCLTALACEGEPQTLFIDDLQWADRASRRLLRDWAATPGLRHTLIVIAYRDNEVTPAHPFMQDLQDFAELGPRFLRLAVGPLSLANAQDLLADSLHRPREEMAELAALCLAKTAGNPFFLRRFIEDLVQRRLLAFDAAAQRWDWSLAQIATTQMAENAVALMIEQLAPLPEVTRHTLTVAAFLGASFDLDMLATVLACEPSALAADLLPALQAQLLVPGSSLYRYAAQQPGPNHQPAAELARAVRYNFAHDRVQEAAYQLVSADARMALRLKIGRLMRQGLAAEAWPFDVVNHLNAALPLITAPAERAELAEANEQASLQAMRSAAFELAADYADLAVRLRPASAWQSAPEAMLALHLHAARMAYLSGRPAAMEALLDAALVQNPAPDARARLLEVRIEAFYAQGQLTDTLDLGLDVLAMLGAVLPQAQTPAEVVALVGAVRSELGALGLPALAALPPMTDAHILHVISISTKMTAASYIARPALLPLLTVFQVRLMMAHGHVPGALSAFSVLGLMFAEFLGDYRLAYDLGRLTMAQVQSQGWMHVYAHAGFSFNAFLRHWVEPLSQSLPGLKETYRNGLEFGNLRHAGLGLYVHDFHAFLAGQPLPALALDLAEHLAGLRAMRQPVAADYESALLATVQQLMLPRLPAEALEGPGFSGSALAATYAARKDQTGLVFLHAWRALLHFLADRNSEALAEGRAAAGLFAAARGMHAVPLVVFISAVAGLRLNAPDALADARAALARLAKWNAAGPGTFAAKHQMLAAEIAAAEGRDALSDFNAAIASAQLPTTGTPLDAALAQSLLGRYLSDARAGDPISAAAALAAQAQARLHLLQWGAVGVANALVLLPHAQGASSTGPQRDGRAAHAVDLSSLMKAVQAITTEPDLPRLLQRLLQVVAENAGAQRAAVVLASGQDARRRRWMLQGEARLTGQEPAMPSQGLENLGLEDAADLLPLGLLRRVLATGHTVLIEDARQSRLDASSEAYFTHNRSRSALSIALVKQGETVGALYLENDSAPGVFTAQRVEFLELLCANVVSAVDNVRLLSELQELTAGLERRVERRTRELRDSEARLRVILDNAPVAMTLTRRSDGMLIYANEAAARTINTAVADIVGRPARNFYRDAQDRQRLLGKYQSEGLLVAEECCLLASDGSARWVLISMVEVLYNAEVADLSTVVDITERKAMEVELLRLATTDSLTGAANRRSFLELAAVEIARSKRHGFPMALVMMDIDHFKRINDTLGHAMGDAAIRKVVQACSQLVRKQDMVGRLGGEEFALLLPQTELESARLLVERLREEIAAIGLHKDGVRVPGLTASFGVTVLRADDSQIDDLLARADEALYAAKNAGRNRVISLV